ncbi:MAG TPA: NAD-dependent epimerase/dehydratase family protein [Pyrinomonadaceae bacterium]|nr:NAD-dependent epimerase/dehydratase family protein [Pyrinomonadaceae bacterium]
MRILFSGGSSPVGARVLQVLLEQDPSLEIWCGVHKRAVPLETSAHHLFPLDLEAPIDLDMIPEPIDLVVHLGALTHSRDEQKYWTVNQQGTRKLALAARSRGCKRFVFVSTQCASLGSGAYGESKLAAESELLKLDWTSLLIIRPADIYGNRSTEGVDRFIQLAQDWRLVPLLFGHGEIRFAPLHFDDFAHLVVSLILTQRPGVQIVHLRGPEEMSGFQLGRRIASRFGALPLPVWWPAVKLLLNTLHLVGLYPVTPDQLKRAVGKKCRPTTQEEIPPRALRRFLDS